MTLSENDAVFNSIRKYLDEHQVAYEVRRHEPTLTSEAAAEARGEELRTGAKALLMKCGDEFRLLVLPADCRLDSKAVRRMTNVRKARFATKEELLEFTGLVPGSVPPFGKPVLPFPLHIDERLTDNERVAFNAGMLTRSIVLPATEYFRVANGAIGQFSIRD